MKLTDLLNRLGACPESKEWSAQQTGSLHDIWLRCEDGGWLLWLAVELKIDRRLVVSASCDCAEQALEYLPVDVTATRVAIETARKWCEGEATREEVRAAVAAAAADAAAAAADAAAAAAAAAAYAAAAAAAVAAAAAAAAAAVAAAAAAAAAAAEYAAVAAAAAAAEYAADAADACDGEEARAASLKHSADLVRAAIPWEVWKEAINNLEEEQ